MLAPGMRRTAQRTMVYNAIGRLGSHCTAEEITDELHKTKPGFPRSTVYRALEALTASGSVYAAHLGDGPTHYELATGDHHHAVCQVCGGVMHIQEELVSELETHLEEGHGFKQHRRPRGDASSTLTTAPTNICAEGVGVIRERPDGIQDRRHHDARPRAEHAAQREDFRRVG
jgi:Fe2+ or Zn2+ uptake regulation protein